MEAHGHTLLLSWVLGHRTWPLLLVQQAFYGQDHPLGHSDHPTPTSVFPTFPRVGLKVDGVHGMRSRDLNSDSPVLLCYVAPVALAWHSFTRSRVLGSVAATRGLPFRAGPLPLSQASGQPPSPPCSPGGLLWQMAPQSLRQLFGGAPLLPRVCQAR